MSHFFRQSRWQAIYVHYKSEINVHQNCCLVKKDKIHDIIARDYLYDGLGNRSAYKNCNVGLICSAWPQFKQVLYEFWFLLHFYLFQQLLSVFDFHYAKELGKWLSRKVNCNLDFLISIFMEKYCNVWILKSYAELQITS